MIVGKKKILGHWDNLDGVGKKMILGHWNNLDGDYRQMFHRGKMIMKKFWRIYF